MNTLHLMDVPILHLLMCKVAPRLYFSVRRKPSKIKIETRRVSPSPLSPCITTCVALHSVKDWNADRLIEQ